MLEKATTGGGGGGGTTRALSEGQNQVSSQNCFVLSSFPSLY